MYITFNIIIAFIAIFFILKLIVHTGLRVLKIIYEEPQPAPEPRKTEWAEAEIKQLNEEHSRGEKYKNYIDFLKLMEKPQKDFDALRENRQRAAEIGHKYYGPITAHYSPQSIRAARQKRLTQIDGRWQYAREE